MVPISGFRMNPPGDMGLVCHWGQASVWKVGVEVADYPA